ncbi:MAG: AbrB/MazE/SpoVT family DNA-binding domain-containing protein [Candidatus Desantisbacteria bacterium]
MSVVNVSYKGQIVIPVEFRKKFGIIPKGKVEVTEINNEIVILPLLKDPIKQGRGFLRLNQSIPEIMQEVKEEEKRLEDKKIRRFL